MRSLLVALVLRALRLLQPGLERQGDAQDVAEAIARAVEADAARAPLTGSHAQDAVLLAVYAAAESGLSLAPRPWSWDARAGVSCGPWQMRCSLAPRDATGQAATWLRWAREGGLAALDSSPSRARRRERTSRRLLAAALADSDPGAP